MSTNCEPHHSALSALKSPPPEPWSEKCRSFAKGGTEGAIRFEHPDFTAILLYEEWQSDQIVVSIYYFRKDRRRPLMEEAILALRPLFDDSLNLRDRFPYDNVRFCLREDEKDPFAVEKCFRDPGSEYEPDKHYGAVLVFVLVMNRDLEGQPFGPDSPGKQAVAYYQCYRKLNPIPPGWHEKFIPENARFPISQVLLENDTYHCELQFASEGEAELFILRQDRRPPTRKECRATARLLCGDDIKARVYGYFVCEVYEPDGTFEILYPAFTLAEEPQEHFG